MPVDIFDQDAYWKAVNESSGGEHLKEQSCFIEDREFHIPPEDLDPDDDPSFCDGEDWDGIDG